ncbi:hypothetical protein GGX14DRAFT_664211 [Mycena pura]|uniref:Fungal-type protein kinase domain-containing protein n=1 Tax=Mycena pura TaxID=153505 RepID=A0AAD6YL55_9AGAR|nr:hypothetical protein GGX14DRAFT_664211 [Mycena pura]
MHFALSVLTRWPCLWDRIVAPSEQSSRRASLEEGYAIGGVSFIECRTNPSSYCDSANFASHQPNPYSKAATRTGAQAALSPLEQSEANALAQREESMSLLTCRGPPGSSAASILLKEATDSELLQTSSEAVEYPDKTLITLSATGIKGSIAPDVCKAQRELDARLGSSALVDKLKELEDVARSNLDQKLQEDVLDNFALESDTSSKPEERRIDGRYWLTRLADVHPHAANADGPLQAADANSPGPLAMDYVPTPNGYLPDDKHHGYRKKRKYDAALRPSAAAKSTILNILVNVEFTRTEAPSIKSNPLIGATDMVGKYQQAIINADDILTFQPTRLFVPTLSFHGKGAKTKLFVSILSQDRLEIAVIDDCFGSNNFPAVSALLHLFRVASLYQLGYNPLFTYSFTSPLANFSEGDIVPASVVIPGMKEEGREWRERIVIEALHALSAEHPTGPTYAPKLLGSFAAVGYDCPASSECSVDVPALVIRHPEVMVFDSPTDGRKLTELSAPEFLNMAKQLFEAILDAYSRRVLHRDVSINNIRATSQLVLYDWEIGRLIDESPADPQGTVAGTLDTMSVASLDNRPPLPHDDIESAVYVLLKVLTQNFVPPENQKEQWEEILERYHWGNPDLRLQTLSDIRMGLWNGHLREYSPINKTLHFLSLAGHEARVKLIVALLSLSLPAKRKSAKSAPVHWWSPTPGIDGSDHKEVLSSLEKLVEEAIRAVDSVDANDLMRGWIQEPAAN